MIEKRIDWNGIVVDNWGGIKKAKNRLFLYGGGNVAENILARCQDYKIQISGILVDFIKDEENNIENIPIYDAKCFLESLTEKVDIIIAFAAGYRRGFLEVLKQYDCISHVYEVANPYMNHKKIESEYVLQELEKFEEAYNLLADEISKETFAAFINSRITENAEYVRNVYNSKNMEFSNDVLSMGNNEVFLDIGAYKGASIKRFVNQVDGLYAKAIGIEADPVFYSELTLNCSKLNAEFINYGCWNSKTTLRFLNDNKCSRLDPEGGNVEIKVDTVDNLIGENKKITVYYLGISSCEYEIIEGSKNIIQKWHPKMIVFLGAAKDELYSIPQLIHSIDSTYQIYLRFIDAMPSRLYLYAI